MSTNVCYISNSKLKSLEQNGIKIQKRPITGSVVVRCVLPPRPEAAEYLT
jgi:hypothetical protein